MGMTWDEDLHDGVTHLIANMVGSAKHRVALASGMKVVKLEWLAECSRQSKIVATDAFELGILEGLCICTTGTVTAHEAYRNMTKLHRLVY